MGSRLGDRETAINVSTIRSGDSGIRASGVDPGEILAGKYRIDRVLGAGGGRCQQGKCSSDQCIPGNNICDPSNKTCVPTTGGGTSANQGGGGCKMAGMPVRRGIPLTWLGALAALALARRRRRHVALSARAAALFVAIIAFVAGCGSSEPTHDAPPDAGTAAPQPLVIRALGLPALRGVTDPVKRAARIRAAQTNPGPGFTVKMDGDTARFRALGLRLAGAPAVTSRSAVGNRVELRRGADLTEWYASGPLGLEQGFDVARAPSGGEIVLDVAVTGAEAVQAGDGEIALVGAAQQIVARYGEADATDATGALLDVELVAEQSGIEIRVAAGSAVFPVTIDPMLWLTQAELLASDRAANDIFGTSAALSGDTALIGAYGRNGYTGAAYVFVRSGGSWSQQQELLASDGASGDMFGSSVALSVDTALVGAEGHTGAAYVFVRSGSSWTQQQKLVASDGASGDMFGISVALSGDTALVGARRRTTPPAPRTCSCAPARPGANNRSFSRAMRRPTASSVRRLRSLPTPRLSAPPGMPARPTRSCIGQLLDRAAGVPRREQREPGLLGRGLRRHGTGSRPCREQRRWHSVHLRALGNHLDRATAGVCERRKPERLLRRASALTGGAALVGADNGAGTASSSSRSGTTWSEQKELTPFDGAAASARASACLAAPRSWAHSARTTPPEPPMCSSSPILSRRAGRVLRRPPRLCERFLQGRLPLRERVRRAMPDVRGDTGLVHLRHQRRRRPGVRRGQHLQRRRRVRLRDGCRLHRRILLRGGRSLRTREGSSRRVR